MNQYMEFAFILAVVLRLALSSIHFVLKGGLDYPLHSAIFETFVYVIILTTYYIYKNKVDMKMLELDVKNLGKKQELSDETNKMLKSSVDKILNTNNKNALIAAPRLRIKKNGSIDVEKNNIEKDKIE